MNANAHFTIISKKYRSTNSKDVWHMNPGKVGEVSNVKKTKSNVKKIICSKKWSEPWTEKFSLFHHNQFTEIVLHSAKWSNKTKMGKLYTLKNLSEIGYDDWLIRVSLDTSLQRVFPIFTYGVGSLMTQLSHIYLNINQQEQTSVSLNFFTESSLSGLGIRPGWETEQLSTTPFTYVKEEYTPKKGDIQLWLLFHSTL